MAKALAPSHASAAAPQREGPKIAPTSESDVQCWLPIRRPETLPTLGFTAAFFQSRHSASTKCYCRCLPASVEHYCRWTVRRAIMIAAVRSCLGSRLLFTEFRALSVGFLSSEVMFSCPLRLCC